MAFSCAGVQLAMPIVFWGLFAVIPALTLLNLLRRLFSDHGLPPNLPWIGIGDKSPLSRARAHLNSFFDLRSLLDEGYDKVSIPFSVDIVK